MSKILPAMGSWFKILIMKRFIVLILFLFSKFSDADEIRTIYDRGAENGAFEGCVDLRMYGGNYHADYIIGVSLGSLFTGRNFTLGLLAPLRFMLKNESNIIRIKDWDEAEDFARVIPFILFGGKKKYYELFVGNLAGISIGHGTIVHKFYSTMDEDHYRGGIHTRVDLEEGGFEGILSSFTNPSLVGFRGYLKPLVFFNLSNGLKRLSFGFSIIGDFKAPMSFNYDNNGVIITNNTALPSMTTSALSILGIDTDWNIYKGKIFEITPYVDGIFEGSNENALHSGVFLGINPSKKTELGLRVEHRYLSSNYIPVYFDSLYQIEKFNVPSGETKISKLISKTKGGYSHGFLTEFSSIFDNSLRFGISYEDSQLDDDTKIGLSFTIKPIQQLIFSTSYYLRYASSFGDFINSGKNFIVSEIKLGIGKGFNIFAMFAHQKMLKQGKYIPTNDFFSGISFIYP